MYQNRSQRYLLVFFIDQNNIVWYDFIQIVTLHIGIKKDWRPDNLGRNWLSVLLFQGHKKQQKKHVHATVSAVAISFATNAEEPGKVLSLKEFEKSEKSLGKSNWHYDLFLKRVKDHP